MKSTRGDEPRIVPSEPALRVIMRRLREIMSSSDDGQTRLNQIVHQIAGVMVAEVCSIYLKRQDGSLELFATEGLKTEAVHTTSLKRGEGLVGRCAEFDTPINEPEAKLHPAFSYRPETGEEVYHSLLAVPIHRSGQVLGVLVVQNQTRKDYSEEDVEVLQATAMVVAENLMSGNVAGSNTDLAFSKSMSSTIAGEVVSEGIALGHIVLHKPRIVVKKLMSDDPVAELARLETAILQLGVELDRMFSDPHLAATGDHHEIFEAYRMFAKDRGWQQRLRDAVRDGLTAEAAVERVQNGTRARLLRQVDPYWHERTRDLDDLSDRLLRTLMANSSQISTPATLPDDIILVARTIGPAELLDYDRSKLRGLIVEDGSAQSHVAIVARALDLTAIGQIRRVVERVSSGDAAILDGETGEIHLRPSQELVDAYSDKVRFRARRQKQFAKLKDKPAATKDGELISLHMNAGLQLDMAHLDESGADGIGLFRTELLFMLSNSIPRLERQIQSYRAVLDEAGDKPVIFRSLDVGGDKVLPYLRSTPEENPAIGWRAIRMSLDRPGLFRLQVRAFLRASAGKDLNIMIPMVTQPQEIDDIRNLIDKEIALIEKWNYQAPLSVSVGAMLEVPSLLFDLDALMERVDFVSVGSNDLLQFLFAADRTNARIAGRFDALSHAPLMALREITRAADRHDVKVAVCGEMAGRPLEAMALIGLGYRTLSMSPASIGPVKEMILSLNHSQLVDRVTDLLQSNCGQIRESLQAYAGEHNIEI
ncbi:MAG: phosphoenolpyruvate--protein phosphotransferase [Hyphomicrobiaceae bacterium]